MSAPVSSHADFGPDWVIAEMPPGYGNRVAEIRRLTAELEDMGHFGRLLFTVGPALAETIKDVFSSLGYEAEVMPAPGGAGVAVKLDKWKRLLLHVASDGDVVRKKSAEISSVFQILHEFADEHDRVVFVTNREPEKRPSDRGEALSAEALAFVSRMGVAHVPSATLFTLWKLSLQAPDRARQEVQRIHANDEGTFHLSPGALAS